jgi:glycosyltransferase involved in cell wall biosynthesis
MFYLVSFEYSPNTAPCNRVIAYVKALSELGIKTKVVFFIPDKTFSRFDGELENIEFEYLWEKNYINIPRLKKLSFRLYIWQFIKRLQFGDKVFVYAFPELTVALSRQKDIQSYHETTEHPDATFFSLLKSVKRSDYLEACKQLSGIVVISQPLQQYFVEKGCQPDKVHVVNMIVDSSRFYGLSKQNTEPYIAYCGTASNNKDGVDELIKAFALVLSKHPEYKLYIIGPTPSKKQRFENLELVKKLGIERNVVFLGRVSREDIPQLLKNAQILALDRPDNLQAKYGFPTKLGEYLLTGNPVVVTKVGDIPLFLKDGESALIAEPQIPQDFADKVCWAIEHREEACAIGKKGKIVAERHFNNVVETQKLVDIIFPNNKINR